AGVIPKPRPFAQHVLARRGGERLGCRPQIQEPREVRLHRSRHGLLQHYLGQPDFVWVGPPFAPAPGQIAAIAVVPGEQRPARLCGRLCWRPCEPHTYTWGVTLARHTSPLRSVYEFPIRWGPMPNLAPKRRLTAPDERLEAAATRFLEA